MIQDLGVQPPGNETNSSGADSTLGTLATIFPEGNFGAVVAVGPVTPAGLVADFRSYAQEHPEEIRQLRGDLSSIARNLLNVSVDQPVVVPLHNLPLVFPQVSSSFVETLSSPQGLRALGGSGSAAHNQLAVRGVTNQQYLEVCSHLARIMRATATADPAAALRATRSGNQVTLSVANIVLPALDRSLLETVARGVPERSGQGTSLQDALVSGMISLNGVAAQTVPFTVNTDQIQNVQQLAVVVGAPVVEGVMAAGDLFAASLYYQLDTQRDLWPTGQIISIENPIALNPQATQFIGLFNRVFEGVPRTSAQVIADAVRNSQRLPGLLAGTGIRSNQMLESMSVSDTVLQNMSEADRERLQTDLAALVAQLPGFNAQRGGVQPAENATSNVDDVRLLLAQFLSPQPQYQALQDGTIQWRQSPAGSWINLQRPTGQSQQVLNRITGLSSPSAAAQPQNVAQRIGQGLNNFAQKMSKYFKFPPK